MSELRAQITGAPKPETRELDFRRPHWWREMEADEPFNYQGKLRYLLWQFVNGTLPAKRRNIGTGKSGKHYYYTKKGGSELWLFKDNPVNKVHLPIAKIVGNTILGNASGLMPMKSYTGNINWAGGPQAIQSIMEEMFVMVPFRTFEQANLDISKMRMVEKAKPELIELENGPRHFTGAMVFEVDGRYFIFDLDRNEVTLKNWNVFLTEVPRKVTSVADAYESLKPDEVRHAERFMKKPAPRQGEWFFLPVGPGVKVTPRKLNKWMGGLQLKSPDGRGGRPHMVSQMSAEGFVRGRVSHTGGEHITITLKEWHRPVMNAGVFSFKVDGSVD